jgi:tetratricopeptide (TPR) repeat protein
MKNAIRLLHWFLVALVVFSIGAGTAYAAREKKDNPYPNATRKEPRADQSSMYTKVVKANEYVAEGEMDKAAPILDDVVAGKRTTNYEKALAYQLQAQIAYEKDDIAGAIRLNQQAIDLDALDNASHFALIYQIGQLNLMEENYEGTLNAIDTWQKQTGAQTADSLAVKGNALYRLERYDEAAVAMKQAIAANDKPNNTWYQILIASYYENEKFAEASAVGEEILAKDPDNKQLIMQLASIYLENQQEAKALAMLESAYKRGLMKEASEVRQLYQMYNYLQKPEQAAQIITEGLAAGTLKPDFETYKGLAESYALAADSAEAETPQRKALFTKAIDAYGKAAPLAPDGEMEFQRGQLMIQETEQLAEGKAAMTAAIAKGGIKREGEAYVLLGNAEYELGNTQAAIAAFTKAKAYPSTKSMAEQWLKSAQQK